MEGRWRVEEGGGELRLVRRDVRMRRSCQQDQEPAEQVQPRPWARTCSAQVSWTSVWVTGDTCLWFQEVSGLGRTSVSGHVVILSLFICSDALIWLRLELCSHLLSKLCSFPLLKCGETCWVSHPESIWFLLSQLLRLLQRADNLLTWFLCPGESRCRVTAESHGPSHQ